MANRHIVDAVFIRANQSQLPQAPVMFSGAVAWYRVKVRHYPPIQRPRVAAVAAIRIVLITVVVAEAIPIPIVIVAVVVAVASPAIIPVTRQPVVIVTVGHLPRMNSPANFTSQLAAYQN